MKFEIIFLSSILVIVTSQTLIELQQSFFDELNTVLKCPTPISVDQCITNGGSSACGGNGYYITFNCKEGKEDQLFAIFMQIVN